MHFVQYKFKIQKTLLCSIANMHFSGGLSATVIKPVIIIITVHITRAVYTKNGIADGTTLGDRQLCCCQATCLEQPPSTLARRRHYLQQFQA